MSERVLLQVVRLDELHATLAADVWPDVFVFHHVVLKLARVLEGFLAFPTPADASGSISRPTGNSNAAHNNNNTFLSYLWLDVDSSSRGSLPVEGGAAVGGQVSLQLGQRGEAQATLHAHVLLPLLVLQLVGAELAGVGEAPPTHATAGEKRATRRRRSGKRRRRRRRRKGVRVTRW